MAASKVPIMSIAQRKKALVKKKKVIRNILVNPYESYWPVLNEKDNALLSSAFQRIIESTNNTDSKSEDAKQLIKLKRKKWSEFITFAINEVSRSVMKGTIIAVLLADDVDPKFLVLHVATLCGAMAIPVLVISDLRNITKKILGFSSVAIGLKKSVAEIEDNSFNEIYQIIQKMAKMHRPPPSIRQFNIRTSELHSIKKKPPVSVPKEPMTTPKKITPADDVYLYRTSQKSRVFVPEPQYPGLKKVTEVDTKPKVALADFMSLGDDSDFDELMETEVPVKGISLNMLNLEEKKTKTKKHSYVPYVPLKHIQVKPNPNKKPH